MVELIPIQDSSMIQIVQDAAQSDGHYSFLPTHYWLAPGGNIGGAFNCGNIPVGHFWSHSRNTSFQSIRAIKACEQITRERGVQLGMISCQPTSPFYPRLKRLGWKFFASTDLFWKELK